MVRRDELCHEFSDRKSSSLRSICARARQASAAISSPPADMDLTSTAPHITVPAANAPPSQPLAETAAMRQQPQPVLFPEGPPEGHRPIMPHKPVPSHHLRHPRKYSTTPLRPLQIVDEPTCLRSRFHPPQQSDDLLILQMMRHQRAHDDIHRLLRSILQSVAGHPRDSELLRRELRCRTRCIRIQVDPR